MHPLLYILLSVIATLALCWLGLRFYIRRNTIGTFRFDVSGTTPMCTFELEKIPEAFEDQKFVLAKVVKSDLAIPGSHKSQ